MCKPGEPAHDWAAPYTSARNAEAPRPAANPLSDNPNFVHIPHETMRELRKNADERQRYRQDFGLSNTAAFSGIPVRMIDGQWWADLTSQHTVSPNEARQLLKIEKLIEQGDWEYDHAANRIRVWDAGAWLAIPMELVHQIQDQSIVNFMQEGEVIPTRVVNRLKEALAVWEEDRERLALRQLLAESQQEGDDEAG